MTAEGKLAAAGYPLNRPAGECVLVYAGPFPGRRRQRDEGAVYIRRRAIEQATDVAGLVRQVYRATRPRREKA